MNNSKQINRNIKSTVDESVVVEKVSPSKVVVSHLICVIALAASFWIASNVFSVNLIDNPVETLRLLSVITNYYFANCSLNSLFCFVMRNLSLGEMFVEMFFSVDLCWMLWLKLKFVYSSCGLYIDDDC